MTGSELDATLKHVEALVRLLSYPDIKEYVGTMTYYPALEAVPAIRAHLESISGKTDTTKLTEVIEAHSELVAEIVALKAERDEWKNKYLMKISEVRK